MLLTPFLILSFGISNSQAEKEERENFILQGKVIDAITNDPLVGVNVYIHEFNQGAVTNLGGDFSLSFNDNVKNVLLQISFVGYKSKLLRINVEEWKNNTTIPLERESIIVNEVIVSAGRIASRDEIPVLVEKMGIQEMRSDGQINTMTALMKVPGVEQIAYGTGVGKPVIRGMSFSRILSMYQGARYENQQWGADHGLGVNDLGIEAVEIIKGPASFLYGSGAVGGVVYLVDERPARRGKMLANLNSTLHSNTLGFRQTFGLRETKESGWFYGFNLAHENHADYKDGNNRIIGNSRFNTSTLRVNTGLQKQWGVVNVGYTYHLQNLGIIEGSELDQSLSTTRSDRSMQLPFQKIQDHLLTLHGVVSIGKGRLETTFGHHFNLREEIAESFTAVDLGLIQNNTTFDAKYFYEKDNSENVLGLQGFYLQNKNMDGVSKILIPDAQIIDASLYYLYTLRKNNTTYQAGLRYDARNTVGDATASVIQDYGYTFPNKPSELVTLSTQHSGASGSVGVIHKFSKELNVKTNFSSGFRAPDLAELFSSGEHPGTQRFELGNTESKREQNFQLDFALEYGTPMLSFELSPFLNMVANYIYFTPTGEPVDGTDLIVWSFDQENARLFGGELRAKLRPLNKKKLVLSSSFSMVRGVNPQTKEAMPLIPADRIMSSATWNFNDLEKLTNMKIQVNYNYVSQQDRLSAREEVSYMGETTPSFHLLGANLGTDLNFGSQKLQLNLAVNNLLNEAYVDHLSFLRPFNINNIGRNFTLNINVPLDLK